MQVNNNNNNNNNINTVDNIFDDVHVKVQYGNQLRRFSIRRIEITTGTLYAYLVDKIAKLFALTTRLLQLKYKDDEGDLITISSDVELKFAIDMFKNSTLRLIIDDVVPHPIDDCKGHGWKKHHINGHDGHHGWKRQHGLNVHDGHHGWKRQHGLNGHDGHNGWKRQHGHDGHHGWKRQHGLDGNDCGRKGRGACRGRGGWSSEDVENKIVMINKKRDSILEKIELMKENGSDENINGLNCILLRLDSRLKKLAKFISEKNNGDCEKQIVSEQDSKNQVIDQEFLRETDDVNHCRRGGRKFQGRGGKWCNDPLFNTLCALRKEKRELKLVLKGLGTNEEKANAKIRISEIKQEIRQMLIDRRERNNKTN